MLHNKFEMPLDLTLRTSKIFFAYILILFILAFVSVLISSALSISVRVMLIIILIFLTRYLFTRLILTNITGLSFTRDEHWQLRRGTQKDITAELYGECIVTHYLIWLNFITSEGAKIHLLLLSDSADKEMLRLLRIRLRFLNQY